MKAITLSPDQLIIRVIHDTTGRKRARGWDEKRISALP